MATNQVLNAVDEIIDGTPQYYITDNQDGTKNITLANDVTEQGTEINRNLFNKVDNVLSYLTPSFEKETVLGQVHITGKKLLAKECLTTLAQNQYYPKIDVNMDSITSYVTPKLQIKTSSGDLCIRNSASAGDIWFYNSESVSYTSNSLTNVLQRTSKSTSYYIRAYASDTKYFYFDYDFGNITSGTIKYNCVSSNSFTRDNGIYGSNDGSSWTRLDDFVDNGSDNTYNFSNYRYIRIKIKELERSQTNYFTIYYLYFSNISGDFDNLTYRNKFTLDNNTTFSNNQRILLGMPLNTTIKNIFAIPPSEIQNQTRYTTYTGTTNGIFTDGTSPTIEYNLFYVYSTERLNSWTNSQIAYILGLRTSDTTRYLGFNSDSYFTIDLKSSRSFTLKYGANANNRIYTSYDGITWKEEPRTVLSSGNYMLISNARYIKISMMEQIYIIFILKALMTL